MALTLNGYLTNLANSAVLSADERGSTSRSISTLQSRLNAYFIGEFKEHKIFGSYTRGTILPRSMDAKSDIDYMVIFNDSSYQPQTYLNKLNRFVSHYYGRSEIAQSNPTIVLSLNHIKFELVPAIDTWFGGLQIPAKASDLNGWIDTNPNDINAQLTAVNQANHSLIKPMIRLMKYWNAKNNYPFASYELEKYLAERNYFFLGGLLGAWQLYQYFFDAIESLEYSIFDPKYERESVDRAKTIVGNARYYLGQRMEQQALLEIKKLLPPLGLLDRSLAIRRT